MTIGGAAAPASDVRRHLDAIIAESGSGDWSDSQAAQRSSSLVLDRILGRQGFLAASVAELAGSLRGCESYPYMDKLLLWRSDDGDLRLRLHVFSPGYADRPHNHRWSFASRLLGGAYLHTLYGDEHEVLDNAQRGTAPRARFIHELATGAAYFLHHSQVHSLSTETETVSLVLRGPSRKDDYFTWEEASRRVVWSSGAAREDAADSASKAMDDAGYARVLEALDRLGF